MNLVLKGFSQEVSMENPTDIRYFLVFKNPSGGDIRLPVLQETTAELIKAVYSPIDSPKKAAPVNEPQSHIEDIYDEIEEEGLAGDAPEYIDDDDEGAEIFGDEDGVPSI